MYSIKKQLKNQAKQLLPDESLKENIKQQLFPESVSAVETGSGTKAMVKNKTFIITSIALAICILLTVGIILILRPPKSDGGFSTYLTLSVNPRFEFVIDENDNVKSVKPLNKDAVIVLYRVDLVGKTSAQACETVIDICKRLGYLSPQAGAVELLAISSNRDKEAQLKQSINTGILQYFSNHGLSGDIVWKDSSVDESMAQQLGVTQGRLALINEACNAGDMSYEQAQKMGNEELVKFILKYDDDALEDFFEHCESDYFNDDAFISNNNAIQRKGQIKAALNKIEEILKFADDSDEVTKTLKNKVNAFNMLYSEYSYTGDINDIDQIEEYFDGLGETLDEHLDSIDGEVEDALDNLKNHWKQLLEK